MTELARDDTRAKRQAILAAARERFAEQGYEETTIAQIARAAGVAVGTVYLYFANKHDILMDVCVGLNAEIAHVIQSPAVLALPLQDVPRAVIAAAFRKSRENLRFMSCFQVEPQSPAEVLRLRASKQAIADSLDVFFRQLVAERQVPPFDTAAYATLLNHLVSATLQQCFGIEGGEREAFYREGVIGLVERLFFGPPITQGALRE
jgi:AcrR family transcriptional regulator